MITTKQIADQFREVYFHGKWVSTNLKDQLSDVTREQAVTKVGNCNTIAALAFHINYYIGGIADAMETGALTIRDKFSFDMPPLESQADWDNLREKIWQDGARLAQHIEALPDEMLDQAFIEEKYGKYQRNLLGTIEHAYYHLGQIVLLKKLVSAPENA